MAGLNRRPFQGIGNIIRFNWHFYVIALGAIFILAATAPLLPVALQLPARLLAGCIIISTLLSLLVSHYVYDHSSLYTFNWLTLEKPPAHIVNIHAGFDETSALLAEKYPGSALTVLDFYDPLLHTERSIKRARKAYPAYPGTQQIRTARVPLMTGSVDHIYLILSAHEIRNNAEREAFFRQLQNALRPQGCIVVVEHLRDLNNSLAYNIGCFHFLSRRSWNNTFAAAGLQITRSGSLTPFLTTYLLTPQ